MSSKGSSGHDRIGFEPIDPWKSEDLVVTRRNLPHLEVPRATYFVTLRCFGYRTLSDEARDALMAAVHSCDGKSIELDALVVMDDHAHLVFRVAGTTKLNRVLQQIKGRSARQINRLRGTNGIVWMDESFDHIIRHETELAEKIEYLRSNPVKAGMAERPENYRWLYVREGPN